MKYSLFAFSHLKPLLYATSKSLIEIYNGLHLIEVVSNLRCLSI